MLFKMMRLENLLSGELDDSKVRSALEIFGKYYAGYDTQEISDRLSKGDYIFVLDKLNESARKEEKCKHEFEEAIKNNPESYHFICGPSSYSASFSPLYHVVSEMNRLINVNRIMTEYLEKKSEDCKCSIK